MYNSAPNPSFDDIMLAKQGIDPYADGAQRPFEETDQTLEQIIAEREAQRQQKLMDQQMLLNNIDAQTPEQQMQQPIYKY